MSRLIVIEGIDGAGKRTLADRLRTGLAARGASVGMGAFPRYDQDVHADLVRDGLHGKLGPLGDSVYGMAVLYALDRRAGAVELRAALRANDVVLIDRYIASNAAYGSARLHEPVDGEFVTWVHDLEVDRFGLPRPDLQVLLSVPTETAAARAVHRENTEADRQRDLFESDGGLQDRCAARYAELAAASWLSPWVSLDGALPVDVDGLVDVVLS
ncbi:dTMP kinase [Actinoalloteichus hymeniacidonis]|uniref:dTMP kinase n=1 Tax=Actinoalloteichus hymeniacidonis TaxID=340345 RepID=UPI0012F7FC66|nr:dTMP kinase [Actinoalloteichus hymeniacidonis]MBB5906472.1 dTMP kinase [Actinoalloteichus hymeniacidonis]